MPLIAATSLLIACCAVAVCPARGQTYITGDHCHPHNATCDNPHGEFLCDVARCECPFGQVLNQETNECVGAATCGKQMLLFIKVTLVISKNIMLFMQTFRLASGKLPVFFCCFF